LSVNQALQIRRLCQRLIVLNKERELENILDAGYKNGRELIHALREALQSSSE